jgi:TIR domain-containing protein
VSTLWLSYSWKDNVDRDVDFLAQQIESRGLKVKLDRFVLVAGQRLWPQIERHISDPHECDAWAIFLTHNSLSSQAVKEEIAYAVDRALKARGRHFHLSESIPAMWSQRKFL